MTERRPSFFMLGAPKCGTTSLARYVEMHPHVGLSDPREPNYFCSDLERLMHVRDLEAYLDLFGGAESSARVFGEKSTWYLYSEVAVRNIIDFDPEAKLLVMLRDPVGMARSMHQQQLINLNETEPRFDRAWELQEERSERWILQYREVCAVGKQMQRLLDTTGGKNLKVIRFEDLKTDTEGVHLETLAFIGVDPRPLEEYQAFNQARSWRFPALEKFVRHPPKPVQWGLDTFKKVTGLQEVGLANWTKRFNLQQKKAPPPDPDFLGRVRESFLPEVELLESLLGWDLTAWKPKG